MSLAMSVQHGYMSQDKPPGGIDLCNKDVSTRLRVIVFSKDRPSQLFSCLTSLLRNAHGVILDIRVIYAAGDYFAASYDRVAALLPSVKFLREDAKQCSASSFGELLRVHLMCSADSDDDTRHVLFVVDDALWIRRFRAADAISLLDARHEVLTVNLKLAPGMS
eukprot:TRINITY_DN66208_c0_g1_i1.p1 TRINITY_DN66208_c0_g1~~TRINITY_DN66208_c0_g1_i1.p1  ORF type:complete len:164 (+),score=21.32 TRINITY_DN66208_c0_g1_i1:78-569(+)